MAKIGKNFSTGLVGNQITGIRGTNLFSIGNAFTVQTNTEERKIKDYGLLTGDFSEPITLGSLNVEKVNNYTSALKQVEKIKFNFDKSDVRNYAMFGSLEEYIKASLKTVIENYPASLSITNLVDGFIKIPVLDYIYSVNSNKSRFKIPVNCVENPYGVIVDNKLSPSARNISRDFLNYTVLDLDTKNEYKVLEYTGSTIDYLYLVVEGNVFPSASGGTLSKKFHIKPNSGAIEEFFLNLSDLESYLLNRNSKPLYSANFSVPRETPDGNFILTEETLTWPVTDGYNLDILTSAYDDYEKDLLTLGENFDLYKTNLISRFLTTSAIKDFDTADGKMGALLKIYGREFDEINKYITALAHVYKVSYDKKDNTPDLLVKNLAKTLGWDTFDIVSQEDFFDRYLNAGDQPFYSGTSRNHTPAELDTELWRRIVMNTAYLFKSKGTRKAVEFVFRMLGAPDNLVDFNEYVYTVNKKVDIDSLSVEVALSLPIDGEGYPYFQSNTPENYFQMNGGWNSETPLNESSSPIGVHLGEYDGGKLYFDEFKNVASQGVTLEKTVDNQKSWSNSLLKSNVNKDTLYSVGDKRLILNSKEISINIDSSKSIEYAIYKSNFDLNLPINPNGLASPYPNNVNTRKDVESMSFYEYLKFVYENFINVQNRKVITDNKGGGYSTLKMIYEDYLKTNDSINATKLGNFVDSMSSVWVKLAEQVIPATTIWDGGNKYRNTVFDRQKYAYKHGINDGSEFVKRQMVIGESGSGRNVLDISTAPELKGKVNGSKRGAVNGLSKLTISHTSTNTSGSNNDNITLNNVLLVKEYTESTVLILTPPEFYVSGSSKIVTGITSPTVWYTSGGTKPLNFVFTGDTTNLNLGSNPIYDFKYKVLQRSGTGFTNNTPVQSKSFSTAYFSGQTGNTQKELNDIFSYSEENEYLIKGFFNFSATTQNGFITGTTETNSILPHYQFGRYDIYNDWYFLQLKTPSKPAIVADFTYTGNTSNFKDVKLVNQTLVVNYEGQDNFVINDKPIGDIILSINGTILMKSNSAVFADDGEFYVDNTFSSGTIIKLADAVSVLRDDIVTISYLRSDLDDVIGGNLSTIYSIIQNPIVSGTGYPGAKLIFNPITEKQEYWFSHPVNSDVNPDVGDMIVTVNGLVYTKDLDWAFSSSNNYRIVFMEELTPGDTLFIVTGMNGSDNILKTSDLTIKFNDAKYDKPGMYTVEVALAIDSLFENPVLSKTTPYINSGSTQAIEYAVPMGVITGGTKNYIVRVKSENYYTTLMNQTFTGTSYSDVVTFTTTNNNIIGY